MSSTMNINNMDNDMSSNISNLNNNIPNLAKSIEHGLDNTSGQQMHQPDINNYNPTQPNLQKMQEYQQVHQMSNVMGLQQQQQQQQHQHQPMNIMGYQQQMPPQAQYNDMSNYSLMQQNYKHIDAKKPSVLNYVSENFREPILIAVVFVILNHPALLNALGKYIPNLEVGDVEYSMFNLVLRGLFMGIVIVLLNKTVLK